MFAPIRKLIFVLIALFLGETAVMALINYLQLPALLESVLDSSALILIALPILYLQLVRPMVQQYQAAVEARRTAETLLSASMELAQSLDLNDVMGILLKRVKEIMLFDLAMVYLLQSPFWLVLRAVRGYAQETGNESQMGSGIDPRDHPDLMRILAEQKSIAVSDAELVKGWVGSMETVNSSSWVGIPLIASGKVIGLCGFGHLQPHAFTPEQVRLAEGLVSQAAVAVQNARLFEQVRASQDRMQNLTHKTVELQEKERRLIARDLYDDVGQEILSILFQLRLLDQFTENPGMMQTKVADVDRELTSVLEKLHTLAFNLRPACLDHLGLIEAIRQDLDKVREEKGLSVQFDSFGENGRSPGRLPERMETILYRIVQEALTNIVKHARASRIDVCILQQDEELKLIVEDNGLGFQLETVDQVSGLGLFGMRERVEMIGGEISIETSPGQGTTIIVTVPDPSSLPG